MLANKKPNLGDRFNGRSRSDLQDMYRFTDQSGVPYTLNRREIEIVTSRERFNALASQSLNVARVYKNVVTAIAIFEVNP